MNDDRQLLLNYAEERSETACLPTTLPPEFVDTVQGCLSHDPDSRPTATDLQAQLKGTRQAPVVSVPEAVVHEAPAPVAPAQESPKERWLVPTIVAVAVLVLLGAVWAGSRLFKSHPNTRQSASTTLQTSSQQAAAARPAPA